MKNNRYFRHDWNARNDPKMLRLVRVKGAVAKAIYWDIVEMLYEEGGELPIEAIEDISFFNHLDDLEIARYVVFESGLFAYNDTHFWSERQKRDELKINEISSARSQAGRAGGIAKAKQNDSKSVANANQNAGYKINKIKDNIVLPPSSLDKSNSEVDNTCCPSDNSQSLFPKKEGEKEAENEALTNKQCQQVIDYWNKRIAETNANFSKVAALSEARKSKIRIRWKEFESIGEPVTICKIIFNKACQSKFLQGDNNNGWKASFDWIFTNGKNWLKIYEGNYDNNEPQAPKSRTDKLQEDLKYIHDFFNPKDNGTETHTGIDDQ